MSNKQLIIAAAGAGKTTLLVEKALESKNNVLITTFTQKNESEIRRKIIQKKNYVPNNITIDPWFTFLLKHGVRPYQGLLSKERINGLTLVNGRSGIQYFKKKCANCQAKQIVDRTCKKCSDPKYFPLSNIEKYYFDENRKIFSDKIARFVIQSNEMSEGKVLNRISKIFDLILVDEVQDLSGYDLEIVRLLFKTSSDIILVGDPRQSTYSTHYEPKYKKYGNGKIDSFIREKCKTSNIKIDDSTLCESYRCTQDICSFSNRLFPELADVKSKNFVADPHLGVFLVHEPDLSEYIEKYHPTQLRVSKSRNVVHGLPAMNFGEAKGLTFDRVIIYPTVPILKWLLDPSKKLAESSRSELYVALTRARFSAAIYIPSDYGNRFRGGISGTSTYNSEKRIVFSLFG